MNHATWLQQLALCIVKVTRPDSVEEKHLNWSYIWHENM